MGVWAASQAEGATQFFLQPKQLPASSLRKDHPQIRLQLEAPQSTALHRGELHLDQIFNPDIYRTSGQAAEEKDRCG